MSKIKIFLASSGELESERRQFEHFIYQRNKSLHKENLFIEVIVWENSISNAMSPTRLQDKYNEAIRACDIFVALFCTKAGDFTIEEFHIALDQFKKSNQPQIFTYFKKTANKQESVRAFWKELSKLGHFPTVYKNTEDLHLQFGQQLEIILTEHESEPTDFVFPTIPKPDYFIGRDDLLANIHQRLQQDEPVLEKQAKLYQYILAMFEPAELDAEKQTILRYFSVLPAEEIPLAHLKTLFAVEDENQFEDDLESLFQSGWLSAKEDSYKMHALVQDVVFAKLGVDNANVAEWIATLKMIMQQHLDIAWNFRDYASAVVQKISASDSAIGLLNLYLADFYTNVGQLDNALASITQANRHFEQCEDTERLATSYNRLGMIHQALGEVDKALEFFELFTELMKELYESNPKNEGLKNGLAISYEKLGSIHQALGEVDKALEFFELRMQLSKELYESNPKSENLKNGLAISYEKLGDIHQALGEVDKALEFFELEVDLFKELYESNPKNESLKNGLAISYSKLGEIHQALGEVDKALEFFELYNKLMKELYKSNPKNVELKNHLAISYYKLGSIVQAKKIPFYKITAIRQNKQEVVALYENYMTLRQELYQTTQLDSHKEKAENAEKVHLQAKMASYAPIILATLIALFGGFYWLDWLSGWWLVGLMIWIFPLRLPLKTVFSIKIALLILLGLVAWFG